HRPRPARGRSAHDLGRGVRPVRQGLPGRACRGRRAVPARARVGLAGTGLRPGRSRLSMPTDTPLTIVDAAAALRAGSITSLDLTSTLLERAERMQEPLGA